MELRQAVGSDLPQIVRIESICFPPNEAAQEAEIKERFEAFKENFIVALIEDEVVGFINGCTTDVLALPDELYHDPTLHQPNGPYQAIFGLDVLPEYRGQGIAIELMNYFINCSKNRGKRGIILTCKDHLITFYEQFDFRHKGVSLSVHGGSKWHDMVLEF